MELNSFLRNFENAIDEVEMNSLNPDTNFQTEIETWDSLAIILIISMIDSEYNVSISGEELQSCNTINELFEKIKLKL